MSLINDALKRAKESQRKNSPVGVTPLRPVDTNGTQRDSNMVLPVVIIFLITAALVLIGLALAGHAHRIPTENLVAAPVVVLKSEAVSAVPLVKNAPIAPVAAASTVATNPPAPKPLRLQGIAYDAVHPSAIIGGKAVSVGSLVDGMHVTAISANSVTLAGDGHTKTLVVGEP